MVDLRPHEADIVGVLPGNHTPQCLASLGVGVSRPGRHLRRRSLRTERFSRSRSASRRFEDDHSALRPRTTDESSQERSTDPTSSCSLRCRSSGGATVSTSAGKSWFAEDSLVITHRRPATNSKRGYESCMPSTVNPALIELRHLRPDAIRWTSRMPGLDGHQVLARLKADRRPQRHPLRVPDWTHVTDDMGAGLRPAPTTT